MPRIWKHTHRNRVQRHGSKWPLHHSAQPRTEHNPGTERRSTSATIRRQKAGGVQRVIHSQHSPPCYVSVPPSEPGTQGPLCACPVLSCNIRLYCSPLWKQFSCSSCTAPRAAGWVGSQGDRVPHNLLTSITSDAVITKALWLHVQMELKQEMDKKSERKKRQKGKKKRKIFNHFLSQHICIQTPVCTCCCALGLSLALENAAF